MALENYRITEFQEKTQVDNGDYVLIDSATDGTHKYQLSRIPAQASAEVDAAVAAEETAREAADAAEVTARNAAIGAAISEEVTARNAAIAANVDDTLTISGKAADAKKTGDEITSVKSDLTLLNDNVFFAESAMEKSSETADYYMDKNGTNVRNTSYIVDKYAVTAGQLIKIVAAKDSEGVWCFRAGSPFSSAVVGEVSTEGGVFYEEVPTGATYLFVSRLKTTTTNNIFPLEAGRDKNASNISVNADNIEYTMDNLEESGMIPLPIKFEIGGITISDNGWNYRDSTSRIRTPNGYTLALKKGDVIVNADYTKCRLYIGWRLADGTYGSMGWVYGNYEVNNDADFVILATGVPEETVEDVSALSVYVSIHRNYKNTPQHLYDIQNGKILEIKSINHRGYNTVAPENTLPAFKLSATEGFNYVECDVALTSDGIPVILHDDTINRTARNSDGSELSNTIYIKDITYDEALQYDFGVYKDSEYAGTKIPTLEELCVLCHKLGLHIYIEIKNTATFTKESIKNLMDIVEGCGMSGNVTWISFSPAYLKYVIDNNPFSRIGYCTSTVNEELALRTKGFITGKNEAFVDISAYDVTEEQCDLCAGLGIPVEVWMSADNLDTILSLPSYVSGVTSNLYISGKEIYNNVLL